jgi:hypothetical protein
MLMSSLLAGAKMAGFSSLHTLMNERQNLGTDNIQPNTTYHSNDREDTMNISRKVLDTSTLYCCLSAYVQLL